MATMNNIGMISTDPALLNVELPRTLIESASVSTFMPEEEASICPLLTFSHPLTPCTDNHDHTLDNERNVSPADAKADTSSSGSSSSGIGMDAPDQAATTLFNKHGAYQHLQINNNGTAQDTNGLVSGSTCLRSNKTPSFVSWNWPMIRKFTFFMFISSLLAMCAMVVAMIVTLPKTCNPKTAWYSGSVFYEIFPASFQDSNNDGLGDIRGIGNRIDYLASIGIGAVRLNSIFASPNYPEDFHQIASLTEIAPLLGGPIDLQQLAESLHAHNISLILDLPIGLIIRTLENSYAQIVSTSSLLNTSDFQHTTTPVPVLSNSLVTAAILKWMQFGVDGFYIKDLEKFAKDENLVSNLVEWKRVMGNERALIVSEVVVDELELAKRPEVLSYVDLVDVHVDVLNGTKLMEERINAILTGPLAPTEQGAWIHWSIGGVEKHRVTRHLDSANVSLAATMMQLMLPGTISIFYGDEIALESTADPHSEHSDTRHLHHLATMQWANVTLQFTNRETLPWLPQTSSCTFANFDVISKMIALRNRSPAIYKNAICKLETTLPNTQLRRSYDDILILERVYPRRNSFVSVSNFGHRHVTMDMTSMFYSGVEMIRKTDSYKIYFDKFEIGPLETIIVRLDK